MLKVRCLPTTGLLYASGPLQLPPPWTGQKYGSACPTGASQRHVQALGLLCCPHSQRSANGVAHHRRVCQECSLQQRTNWSFTLRAVACTMVLMVCGSVQDCTIPSLFLIIVYSMAALRRDLITCCCAADVPTICLPAVCRSDGRVGQARYVLISLLHRRTAGGFFANWAANMLVQLVAQAFGLLIGATVMDPKAAQVGCRTTAECEGRQAWDADGLHVRESVCIPVFVTWQCVHASADYDERHHAHYDARGWLLCHGSALVDQLDEGRCQTF